MNIYVASSWRNPFQQDVVKALREAGHTVYDFKNPEPNSNGFHWSDVDPEWKSWDTKKFIKLLDHPISEKGFRCDMTALAMADVTVLVMPCGRSAHLELGFAVGDQQTTIALLADGEPELMYKMVDHLVTSIPEVIEILEKLQSALPSTLFTSSTESTTEPMP
jgi:hypothetical protein